MITGFDHVNLGMPEGQEDKARSFYGELLGLSEVRKPDAFASRGGCWFTGQRVNVHLGVQRDFRPAEKAHVAFTVTDLDEPAQRLAAAGYPVIWDDVVPEVRRFFTADPFGNRLEFIQEGRSFTQDAPASM